MKSTVSLFTALLFSIISCALCDHSHSSEQKEDHTSDWLKNRTKTVSNTGVIAEILDKDEDARLAVASLLSHFDQVGREMKKLRNNYHSYTALRTLCNSSSSYFAWYQVKSRMTLFGFRKYRSTCSTDLHFGNIDSILRNFNNLRRVLKRESSRILNSAGLDWKKASLFSEFHYDTFARNCTLYHIPAVRAHSKWALFTAFTKSPVWKYAVKRQRPYLEEVVGVNNSHLIAMPIHVGNATVKTVQSVWGGSPSSSILGVLPKGIRRFEDNPEDNPAVQAAIASSSNWLEQVENSYNPANVAIMMFSCVFAFVPLAAFSETKLHVTFFYVLFTDIFACAPLAIKGIELLHFSQIVHQAVRTRVYGLDRERDLGVAELWVARCSTPMNVHMTGVKFVAIAFISVVVGIAAELFAMYRLKLRKLRTRTKLKHYDMLSAIIPTERWWEKTVCSNCMCVHSLNERSRRSIHASRKFLFRIPSRKLPPYCPDQGWGNHGTQTDHNNDAV